MLKYRYLLETKFNEINNKNKQDIQSIDVLFLRYESVDNSVFGVFKPIRMHNQLIYINIKSFFELEEFNFKRLTNNYQIDYQEYEHYKEYYKKRRKLVGDILLCYRDVRIYFSKKLLSDYQPCSYTQLLEEVDIEIRVGKQRIIETFEEFYLLDIVQISDCEDRAENWNIREIG